MTRAILFYSLSRFAGEGGNLMTQALLFYSLSHPVGEG